MVFKSYTIVDTTIFYCMEERSVGNLNGKAVLDYIDNQPYYYIRLSKNWLSNKSFKNLIKSELYHGL